MNCDCLCSCCSCISFTIYLSLLLFNYLSLGDLQQCTNYRTIALISHASKILLKIIMNRLEIKLDEETNQTQAGFRQNRGTRDHIFNLQMLIEKFREANINLHYFYVCYRLLKSLRLRWTSRNDRNIEADKLPIQDHKLIYIKNSWLQ